MQPLDLYALVEEYLDFEEQVKYLHNTIKDIVIEKKPANLIDIGCGQGELCLDISKAGIKAKGVDLSLEQVNIARSKGIDAEHIDIKDIKKKYDCATAVFDVVNYLPNDYIKSFLKYTYELLNDKGYFIFDINTLFGFEDVAQGTLSIDNDDKFIVIDASFEEDILYTDITLFEKQNDLYKKEQGTIMQYYYKKEQLIDILENIGFNIESIININLHDFDDDDKQIFICKKG